MKEVFYKIFVHRREENWWMNILVPITSIIIALIFGAIFIASTGRDPFLAYKLMFSASGLIPGPYFISHFAEMLLYTALFLSTGLAFALPARAGLFSIGAEGQFIVGAITAAFFGYWKPLYDLPGIIHIPIILIMVIIVGGIWGLIAGYLKAKKGINETIVTIMLNWIAFHLIEGWLVTGPMAADVATGVSGTPYVSPSARLPIILPGTRLNISILIMFVIIYIAWFILYRTVFGYELRAMGYTAITNMEAPKIGGVNTEKRIMQIMFISGAIAALGGSFVVLGFLGQYPPVFEGGYGFDGIAVALIGGNEPVGILFSSILIGALRTGATAVQLARIPKTFPAIIEGLIVAFIALNELIRYMLTKVLVRKKEGVA
ncbi:ABC transporter permease [Caldisericum exile]|uniref:ABC transporter permease protein n=1 Tax=Caldisericum exile (strain DSM 21853 / NBRC 104410 / AZM16c01) TaxID=511051 RepID=A0A7U6JGK0_CALEA|nr:ABC transporter permease [Caldisericum exile]BAL81605.1 ABC transporter permease protein [Caldisericum exile AZM16c01]